MNLTNQPVRQKLDPPIRDRGHLKRVSKLPCLWCWSEPCQAHHVRVGSYQLGKRVCDSKVVPLCPKCHATVHNYNEREVWDSVNIDPLDIAAKLWEASGDEQRAREIIAEARR